MREKLNNMVIRCTWKISTMDFLWHQNYLQTKLIVQAPLKRLYLPDDVKTVVLRKGEKSEGYAEGVMVGKWNDKRVVTFISKEFENDMVDFRTRRQTVVRKPLPIIQYNAYLSGVDMADQLLSYYV